MIQLFNLQKTNLLKIYLKYVMIYLIISLFMSRSENKHINTNKRHWQPGNEFYKHDYSKI